MGEAANSNDVAYTTWHETPAKASTLSTTGFLRTLAYPRLDDCVLASIGPDRT